MENERMGGLEVEKRRGDCLGIENGRYMCGGIGVRKVIVL